MFIGKTLKLKIQQSLRLLPALQLVWQSGRSWTIARIVILVIQSTLPLLSLYLTKLLIDTVSTSLITADKTTVFHQGVVLIVIAGAVTLATTLCNSLAEVVNTAQSQRLTDYMQSILHAKSIEADLEYYENAQYYDALQRAQQEAPYRPNQILNHLAQVGQNGLSLLVMVGLLLSLHWGIVGILLVAVIPAVLVRSKYAQIIYNWQRKWTPIERQATYLGWMLTSDVYAKEIRLFNLGNLFSERFRHLRRQIYKESLALITRRSMASLVAQAIAGIFIFAVYAFILYQTIFGTLRLGDLVLYQQALQRGQAALQGLLGNLSSLYEDNLFLANLYEFLDLKPKLVEPLHPKAIPQAIKTGIIFDHVSFQYSTTTRQALFDINLTIRPGEVVALVGENGSGKTTLIKLLCRLYDPTTGNITIDGIDLSQFKTTELRRQISVIFQDYAKYHLTASENIWLGNIDIPQDHEDVTKAAYRSGADAVIKSLPQGYDTILGKLFDQGEELSIGQWQKIALARAFLRDSQIIVLDEPTSALDPKAEEEVFQKFRQLINGQAAILISHRLSTVKMADCIYVMEHGRIVENGTHEELMQLGASYAHLFETQAQHYR
ncbi:ABC transporter ATP-binding protein [aff. Roholtiella sp. LEGE 12411]|uniref:ABC transporter ATP-binding protein n=1 Tax=aff. Roholtiella sp. LEGE 12411 TaxID=1828822 RepID=UPI001880D4D7|nr:ABC transporter ATP-binding protein [aff. Roholtiella sp. LEGE 12411]MBE9038105.1 ABC transporter ATP-binding protein [aff. Roholtiella sp. LEGE 12411]